MTASAGAALPGQSGAREAFLIKKEGVQRVGMISSQ